VFNGDGWAGGCECGGRIVGGRWCEVVCGEGWGRVCRVGGGVRIGVINVKNMGAVIWRGVCAKWVG